MIKIFLDTNIFIRFLTKDNQEKFIECECLFHLINQGKIKPYTSNIVFLEIFFILHKLYKFPLNQVTMVLEKISKIRNITIIEKTRTAQALALLKKYRIKFADCLIATQIPPKAELVTYDVDFRKIRDLKTIYPEEVKINAQVRPIH